MVDSNYEKIKERMKVRSMELWGIENIRNIDPVIELFLEVFSYELSKIYQEVKISDAKLLERISKILVKENWSLPSPSHALISVQPSENIGIIEKTTQLYFQKMTNGSLSDVFFTPLHQQQLIKAKVYSTLWERQLALETDKGYKNILYSDKENKVPDYTMWVGIEIEKHLLEEITEMPISLLLKNSDLGPYLKMCKIQDYEGNNLKLAHVDEDVNANKEHYYRTIKRYYQDYLYVLDLSNSTRSMHKLTEKCSELFNDDEIEEYEKELFWLKITFPVAFTKEELDKLNISLNTFPIVNRKKSYKQHNVKRNGKIISLYFNENEYFLNVESLIDNEGKIYRNALKNDIDNMKGSFSLYFGDNIQQFDERKAKTILNNVLQTIREEGSSFSAVGYDLLNVYLEDLNEKLDTLESKVSFRYKDVSDNSERAYLQTIPYKTSDTYECFYWTTNADLANNIKTGTLFNQYQTTELESDSILLQTDTVGGLIKKEAKEKISNFRYGLLSKDRIISNEDIKDFVYVAIGSGVKKVDIKSGVGISPNKKQGLIRTTNVDISLTDKGELNDENRKRLEHFLRLELEHKSVHGTPFRINIHN